MNELNKNHNRLKSYGKMKSIEKEFKNQKSENHNNYEEIKSYNEKIYEQSNMELMKVRSQVFSIFFFWIFVNFLIAMIDPLILKSIVSIMVNLLTIFPLGIFVYCLLGLRRMKKSIEKTGKIPKILGFGYEYELSKSQIMNSQNKEKNQLIENFLNNELVLEKTELEHHCEFLKSYLSKEEIAKLMSEEKLDMIGKYRTINFLYEKAKEKTEEKLGSFAKNEENINKQLELLEKKKKVVGWKVTEK